MLEEEIGHLRDALPFVRPALSQEHLDVLDSVGPTEGPAGDRHTPCVDDRACVFVSYDAGVARCSIEQAFHRGEISWRKPLSCHLFPIRADGKPVSRMRFESIPECEPALVKGERDGVPLVEFLDEALERAVGDAWPALKEDMAP